MVRDPALVELARTRLRPGQFVYHQGLIMMRCVDDSVLGISEMVLPFRHAITAEQFYRAHAPRTKQVFTMFYSSPDNEDSTVEKYMTTN